MKRRIASTPMTDDDGSSPPTTRHAARRQQRQQQRNGIKFWLIFLCFIILFIWYSFMFWQVSRHPTAQQQRQLVPSQNHDVSTNNHANDRNHDELDEFSHKLVNIPNDDIFRTEESNNAEATRTQKHTKITDNVQIFFNVYVNPKAPVRSVNIAHEQMRQLANGTLRHNTIWYNIMGSDYPLQPPTEEERAKGRIKPICGNGTDEKLNCTLLGHYPDGNEDITLTDLHSFCQSHPSHKVIYFHNKGSFRKERGNVKLRRICTKSVTSDACLEMPLSQNYPCNVCGVTFQVQPYFHMTANMWVAECSYVRTLMPPKEYQKHRTKLVKSLWEQQSCLSTQFLKLPNLTTMTEVGMNTAVRKSFELEWNLTDPTFLKTFGLGRYAMERWLLSNPSALYPCDVINHRLMRFHHGYEDWFIPKLFPSRHLFTETALLPEDSRELWLLAQELKSSETMNEAFVNFTGTMQPNPCLYSIAK